MIITLQQVAYHCRASGASPVSLVVRSSLVSNWIYSVSADKVLREYSISHLASLVGMRLLIELTGFVFFIGSSYLLFLVLFLFLRLYLDNCEADKQLRAAL